MNPLAKLFSPGALASTMLNPTAEPFTPELLPESNLDPLTMPFIPAGYESSSMPESETSTSPTTSTTCSNLNPWATSFTPASLAFSAGLDPTAPAFTPGLATDTVSMVDPSAKNFITQDSLTSVEDPLEIDCQSAPTDEAFFAEDVDESRPAVNINSSPTELSAMEYPMVDDADTENPMPLEPFLYADEAEYNSQQGLINKYPDIHHFNWLGRGVMAKTSTPAAVSLTIALTLPKGRIVDEDNLKDKTILQEAMLAVDPVVYYGDINEIRLLTGESMREAAIGATAVYYTPFGRWVNDSYEEDQERPVEDELDVTRYPEDVSVINGWVSFRDAPTRQNFWDEAEYANKSALAMCNKAVRERKLYGAGNTRLRNVVTVDGSELTIPAKQIPSGDASGLVTKAGLKRDTVAASPCSLLVEKDDCFPDATLVDDLDQDELVAVNRTPPVVVDDEITENGNCADERDGEEKSVAIDGTLSVVVDDGLFKNSDWADDIDEEDEDEVVANCDAPPAVVDDGLYKNANWADDIDDEEDFVVASGPPSDKYPCRKSSPSISKRDSPVLVSVSNNVSNTEPGKPNKPMPNFRPVIFGTGGVRGGVRFVPVVPIPQELQVQSEHESPDLAPVAFSTGLPADAFKPGNWEEIENDDDDLYGSGSVNASSDSSSTEESFNSSSCSSSSSLEVSLKTAVADETGALEARSQEEIDEEDEFLYGPPSNATKPDETLMPKPLSLPFRPKMSESLPIQKFNLPFRPKPIEVVKEAKGVEEHSDDNQPSTMQAMAEQTKPDFTADSPSGSWKTSPAIFSRLGRKKGRSPMKMRSVASDHKPLAIPKLDLVPASLAAMLTTEGERHTRELDEIEEEDEEAKPASSPNLATHSDQMTTEEDIVNTKVEEAVAMGHVLLKRSPFCEDLPALLPTLAEEEGDSAPVTPEQGLVPSAYERPTSHTPNAMLRKSVRFSLLHDGQDESCAKERIDELTDGTGIGAIFEEDDEEVENDDSGIILGAGDVVHEVDPVYVHTSLLAQAGGIEQNIGTNSGSGSQAEQVFTASPAGTSVPTTVEEGEEGSPEPDIIPRPAKRPFLVAEPLPVGDIPAVAESAPPRAATSERKITWAKTIKGSFGKKAYDGFTDAANVQFTPTRRRTSSWTNIQNKLQKPKFVAAAQEEKNGKKSGLRKALKKVKNVFVKTVKALV